MILATPSRYAAAVFVGASLTSLGIVLILFYFVIRGKLQHHLGQFWIFALPLFLVASALSALVHRRYRVRENLLARAAVLWLNVAGVILFGAAVLLLLA